ncbi:hypothetical protein BG000_011601, partial [Podila horticola]
ILVMHDGQVEEYDTPCNLLRNPYSTFSSLVNETGDQNAAHLRALAGFLPADQDIERLDRGEDVRDGVCTLEELVQLRQVDYSRLCDLDLGVVGPASESTTNFGECQ